MSGGNESRQMEGSGRDRTPVFLDAGNRLATARFRPKHPTQTNRMRWRDDAPSEGSRAGGHTVSGGIATRGQFGSSTRFRNGWSGNLQEGQVFEQRYERGKSPRLVKVPGDQEEKKKRGTKVTCKRMGDL